jgi:hypothetical protein
VEEALYFPSQNRPLTQGSLFFDTIIAGTPICFSKTERMHDLVIGLFINRYEFGLSL